MKYVIGNWKMYPRDVASAKDIVDGVAKAALLGVKKEVATVLCPPMPFLGLLAVKPKKGLSFGAQQVSATPEGAETGEVSPQHLRAAGAHYVLLGHSECRARGETNKEVADKIIASVKTGLVVVLCIGEKTRDEHGQFFGEVATQIRESLSNFPVQKIEQLIIAYEPLWAIGNDSFTAASPRDFEEMTMLIRRTLSELFPKTKAFRVPVLYGGSVQKKNIAGFFAAGADGVLVGRMSLKPKEFSALIGEAALSTHKKHV